MDWFKKIQNLLKQKALPKSGVCVGLDVLETSFPQYVILKKAKDNLSLYDCGRIFDQKKVIQDIHRMTNQVAVSLPRDKVILRVIDLKMTLEEDLFFHIQKRAEQVVPIGLDDLYWNYQVLKKESGVVSILFCAIERDKMHAYQKEMSQLGFKKVAYTISTLSYVNTFLFNYQDHLADKSYLLIDIGMRQLEVCVIHQGQLVFSRSLNLGFEYMIRLIMEQTHVDFSEAQQILLGQIPEQNATEDQAKHVREVFHVWSERVLKELEMAQRLVTTKYGHHIDDFILSGCPLHYSYDLSYISELLKNHFDKEVTIFDPLKNTFLDHQARIQQDDMNAIYSLAVPLGSAMQMARNVSFNVDLFEKQSKVAKRKGGVSLSLSQKMQWVSALILLISLLLSVMTYRGYRSEFSKVAMWQSQLNQVEQDNRIRQKKLKKQKKLLEQWPKTQPVFMAAYHYFQNNFHLDESLNYRSLTLKPNVISVTVVDRNGQTKTEEVAL